MVLMVLLSATIENPTSAIVAESEQRYMGLTWEWDGSNIGINMEE